MFLKLAVGSRSNIQNSSEHQALKKTPKGFQRFLNWSEKVYTEKSKKLFPFFLSAWRFKVSPVPLRPCVMKPAGSRRLTAGCLCRFTRVRSSVDHISSAVPRICSSHQPEVQNSSEICVWQVTRAESIRQTDTVTWDRSLTVDVFKVILIYKQHFTSIAATDGP